MRVAEAGLQKFRRQSAAFVPALVQLPAVNQLKGQKCRYANQRSQNQDGKELGYEPRLEPRYVPGKILQENRGVSEAGASQRGHEDHQPHRASHTALFTLDIADHFDQLVTFTARVVKKALSQKLGLPLAVVHKRFWYLFTNFFRSARLATRFQSGCSQFAGFTAPNGLCGYWRCFSDLIACGSCVYFFAKGNLWPYAQSQDRLLAGVRLKDTAVKLSRAFRGVQDSSPFF
jgi:hypothetical protein